MNLLRYITETIRVNYWNVGRALAQELSCSHCDGLGSSSVQVIRDLVWTKRHWGRFPQIIWFRMQITHSTDCSTAATIYHQAGTRGQ
jgi:hypothetical protein